LSSLAEEDLKDVAVAMTCLDGEELSRAGADGPQDVQPNMIAVVDDAKLRSLHGPASARLRFSVDSRLVAVPQLYVRVFRKERQSLKELLAQLLVLTVGPGLRDFEPVALFMQKPQHCIVGAFYPIFCGNMTVESCRRPEGSLSSSGFLEVFENLLFLSPGDKRFASRPLLRNQTIYAVQIESPRDLFHGAFGKIKHLHDLLSGTAGQKHDDHAAAPVGLLVSRPHGCIEIGKRRVLRVGNEMPLSHDA